MTNKVLWKRFTFIVKSMDFAFMYEIYCVMIGMTIFRMEVTLFFLFLYLSFWFCFLFVHVFVCMYVCIYIIYMMMGVVLECLTPETLEKYASRWIWCHSSNSNVVFFSRYDQSKLVTEQVKGVVFIIVSVCMCVCAFIPK